MTVVLVHGALETDRLWDRMLPLLETDCIALRLPGHAAPRPAGFAATKDAYAEWLTGAIRQVAGPVDAVGHGWGALLVLRTVTALQVPVRSWVVDNASAFHPDFAVRDLERIWQTPDAGERWMSAARGAPPTSPGGAAGRLALLGVPSLQAAIMGAALDDTMSACVLDLARSAIPNARSGWPLPVGPASGPASWSWPALTRSTRTASPRRSPSIWEPSGDGSTVSGTTGWRRPRSVPLLFSANSGPRWSRNSAAPQPAGPGRPGTGCPASRTRGAGGC